MFALRQRRGAFTLVELILVIVMLGLIAAIVIPKFASGREEAGETALRQNLSVLRGTIQRYLHHHNGVYPGAAAAGDGGEAGTAAALVNQLTKYTDVLGDVSDTKDDTHVFGPYLKTGIPACTVGSISGKSDVKVVTVDSLTPDKSTGWLYSTVTGQFVANTNELSSEDTAYNNW